jgi:hypothetical protein
LARDVVEQRMSHQRLEPLSTCSLQEDESSLSFTMLLRLESLFPFSFSPPLAGGIIAMLGVVLLDFDSCVMPVFQTLEILGS